MVDEEGVLNTNASPYLFSPFVFKVFNEETLIKVQLAQLKLEVQVQAHRTEFERCKQEVEAETEKALNREWEDGISSSLINTHQV